MAVITSSFGTSSVAKLIRDTDSNGTVEDNINGGAANVQQVFIDNKANTSTGFYLFMWNLTGSVTFGATKPHTVLFCPAGKSKHYIFPKNLVFGTGICIAGATNFAAATFTPTNPGKNVAVGIYISA
tara:strand:- start:1247 stop:1627 length:381 start_codon:yes stop_codon:yes gene_type:complete